MTNYAQRLAGTLDRSEVVPGRLRLGFHIIHQQLAALGRGQQVAQPTCRRVSCGRLRPRLAPPHFVVNASTVLGGEAVVRRQLHGVALPLKRRRFAGDGEGQAGAFRAEVALAGQQQAAAFVLPVPAQVMHGAGDAGEGP
ncbi:MAG: hypothetical protein ACFCVE_15430 [Phycisphaerae bacterium]